MGSARLHLHQPRVLGVSITSIIAIGCQSRPLYNNGWHVAARLHSRPKHNRTNSIKHLRGAKYCGAVCTFRAGREFEGGSRAQVSSYFSQWWCCCGCLGRPLRLLLGTPIPLGIGAILDFFWVKLQESRLASILTEG